MHRCRGYGRGCWVTCETSSGRMRGLQEAEFQPTRIVKVRGAVGAPASEEPTTGPAWQYNLEWERTDVGKPWVCPSL